MLSGDSLRVVVKQTVHTRALQRAAEILGSTQALRACLDVSQAQLAMWMRGQAPLPADVFLQLVDVLLVRDLEELRAAVGRNGNAEANSP